MKIVAAKLVNHRIELWTVLSNSITISIWLYKRRAASKYDNTRTSNKISGASFTGRKQHDDIPTGHCRVICEQFRQGINNTFLENKM